MGLRGEVAIAAKGQAMARSLAAAWSPMAMMVMMMTILVGMHLLQRSDMLASSPSSPVSSWVELESRQENGHESVDQVIAGWKKLEAEASRELRASKLAAAAPQSGHGKLAGLGVNTGEEYDHTPGLDVTVRQGHRNPSYFFSAESSDPDLVPNLTPTASPMREKSRLDDAGINTGSEHSQWDDEAVSTSDMEDPYSVGSSPHREWNSPSHRAGGIFAASPRMSQLTSSPHAPVETSNHHLSSKGVNTGEAGGVDLGFPGDNQIRAGHANPAHMISTGQSLPSYSKSSKTAKPRATKDGALNRLGVNTGDEHSQWDDAMVQSDGLEESYNIGISPGREYHNPAPLPGTASWPARGQRTVGVEQKLLGSRRTHSFFRRNVQPLLHAKARRGGEASGAEPPKKVLQAATGFLKQAAAEEARAKEAEKAFEQQAAMARRAENLALKAKTFAEKVGEAKLKEEEAQEKLKAAEGKFRKQLKASEDIIPASVSSSSLVGGPKAAKSAPAVSTQRHQGKLEEEAKKDRMENKKLASTSDVQDVFAAINGQKSVASARKVSTKLVARPPVKKVPASCSSSSSSCSSSSSAAVPLALVARVLSSPQTRAGGSSLYGGATQEGTGSREASWKSPVPVPPPPRPLLPSPAPQLHLSPVPFFMYCPSRYITYNHLLVLVLVLVL
eukprot:765669-Hanusia_phi.AAC.1